LLGGWNSMMFTSRDASADQLFFPIKTCGRPPIPVWSDPNVRLFSPVDDAQSTKAEVSLAYELTLLSLAEQVRELLSLRALSSDAIDEVAKRLVRRLDLLPASRETKQLVREITRLLARAATAAGKGKESKARAALTTVVNVLDQHFEEASR